jgi:hypothetical protein
MKILTILLMCCGSVYAADTTNTPTVSINPTGYIVVGHGDVGQFILRTVIQFGGTLITTNGLPPISDQWSYADDSRVIVINLTHQELPAVDSFLHQSFGQTAWRHDGQSAFYQLTTNGCSISFEDEDDATYVAISRPRSNESAATGSTEQSSDLSSLKTAELLYQVGQFDSAELALRAILKADPENQTAAMYLHLVERAQVARKQKFRYTWVGHWNPSILIVDTNTPSATQK